MNLWMYIKNQGTTNVDKSKPKLVDFCKRLLPYEINLSNNLVVKFRTNKDFRFEVSEWCDKNFKGRYCLWDDVICCQNQEDLFKFGLRWL